MSAWDDGSNKAGGVDWSSGAVGGGEEDAGKPSWGKDDFSSAKADSGWNNSGGNYGGSGGYEDDNGYNNDSRGGGGGGGSRGGPREGDWACPSCGNSNFASRFKCRQCNTPNPSGGGGGGTGGGGERPTRPGDWGCPSCSFNNFASRMNCMKCNTAKPEDYDGGASGGYGRGGGGGGGGYGSSGSYGGESGGGGYGSSGGAAGYNRGGYGGDERKPTSRPGDWKCPSCGFPNFASRMECNKCATPKPDDIPTNGGAAAAAGPPRTPRSHEDPTKPHVWASSRKRYEWKEEYGAGDDPELGLVAPADKELEEELFGEESHVNTGLHFDKYSKINVRLKGTGPEPIATFEEAKLHPIMKENIRLAKYTVPTPVQRYSIPIITEGKDLMACAQTGSGKTAAFLIPILSKLFGKAKQLSAGRARPAQPLVLIMAPTRELCGQIFDECRRFTYRSMLRPCAIYGGAESQPQRNELSRGCDILAATPGRLSDFMEKNVVSLRRIKYLILDEADRMLDMGFEEKIREVVEGSDLPKDRQTLMYSATFPRTIRILARDFLSKEYLFLKVGRVGGTSEMIKQTVMFVEEQDKRTELMNLLLSQPPSRTLIFVETKRGADSLDEFLYQKSFPSTSIHGDRTQREREDALLAFKSGRCPILVATAVAARGLDIRNVMHVINYDLCNDIDEYIHRIGRTARVGNEGLATSFYNDSNSQIAPELTKLLLECKQEIPSFLSSYKTDNLVFDEDLDEDMAAPSASAYSARSPTSNPSYDLSGASSWGPPKQEQGNGGWGSSAPAATTGDAWNANQTNWGSSNQQAPGNGNGGDASAGGGNGWNSGSAPMPLKPDAGGGGGWDPAPVEKPAEAAVSSSGWGDQGPPAPKSGSEGWGAPAGGAAKGGWSGEPSW